MIDQHRAERDGQVAVEPPPSAVETSIDDLLSDGSASSSIGVRPFAGPAPARKPRYTADLMVQLMIDHPEYTHKQFADHFGYKASWFAGVLISNNFQYALEQRRSEVINPQLTGTMDDMFRSLLVQSLTVLQQRLEDPRASEDLILKAAALGVKALGMGTSNQLPPPPAAPTSLHDLARQLAAPVEPIGQVREYTIDATLGEMER